MVRVRCTPRNMSVLRFCLAASEVLPGSCPFCALVMPLQANFGGPIATRAPGNVHFRYGLANAGQPLMVCVRCMPTDMSVSRFGMGKDGQPLVARLRRALNGMSIIAIVWPREASP